MANSLLVGITGNAVVQTDQDNFDVDTRFRMASEAGQQPGRIKPADNPDFVMVAVSWDEDPDQLRAFLTKYPDMARTMVVARDPGATMLVLPADQLIQDTAAYHAVMRDAIATAEKSDGLVTIGIKPTWPCPSYGYIERGNRAVIPGLDCENPPAEVKRFREKPSTDLAETFLARGTFCWNAGMFVWSLPTVIHELTKHAPELANFVSELRRSKDVNATVEAQFPKLSPISIDYALMEQASRVLNIEATFDWDDVGSWLSVAKYLDTVGDNNQVNTPVTEVDSENNIVFNARKGSHIALLGVDDLIVVQTEDAILIANRHQADAIKKLGDKLPPELL